MSTGEGPAARDASSEMATAGPNLLVKLWLQSIFSQQSSLVEFNIRGNHGDEGLRRLAWDLHQVRHRITSTGLGSASSKTSAETATGESRTDRIKWP